MGIIIDKKLFQKEIRPSIKKDNKTIALCHGVFDLLHPGHIIHLKQAKDMADYLVVSITAAEYVNKGPGRPYYDDETRMNMLAALACVDYVILSEGADGMDALQCVMPDVYVKGSEYQASESDISGGYQKEREYVNSYGGRVTYTTGKVYSSTKLINTVLSGLSESSVDYLRGFKEKYTVKRIRECLEEITQVRVLVVGQIIYEKYVFCDKLKMLPKDSCYTSKMKYEEEYLGGAAAFARQLHELGCGVDLLSFCNRDKESMMEVQNPMHLIPVYRKQSDEIERIRYVSKNTLRKEYTKIFDAHTFHADCNGEEDRESYKQKYAEIMDCYDVVVLYDIGDNLLDDSFAELAIKKNKKVMICCANDFEMEKMGSTIQKYHKAETVFMSQFELSLAEPYSILADKKALKELSNRMQSTVYLTRGSEGAMAVGMEESEVPALTLKVVDTTGAGDAFYAIASAFQMIGAEMELCTFMGSVGGALGANIIGHKEVIHKDDIIKYCKTLLNV